MKKSVAWGVVFLGGIILDWWWGRFLSVYGVSPGWLIIGTVAVAATRGTAPAESLGFFWGLFLDVMAVDLFGGRAWALVITGYAVGLVRKHMDLMGYPSQIVLLGVVSLVYFLFIGLLGLVFAGAFVWCGWKMFIFGSLMNCVVGPLVFRLLEFWQEEGRC